MFLRSDLKDGRRAFIARSASLVTRARGDEIVKNWHGVESLTQLDREELDEAARTTSVVLLEGFKDEIQVDLGAMVEPIKALQACATDLVKSWGIDPLAVAGMSRYPDPVQPTRTWLKWSDYPEEMLRERKGGFVELRLIINEDGSIGECRFELEEPGVFETTVCQKIRARIRFTPALDAQGKPMRTYWRQAVHFSP